MLHSPGARVFAFFFSPAFPFVCAEKVGGGDGCVSKRPHCGPRFKVPRFVDSVWFAHVVQQRGPPECNGVRFSLLAVFAKQWCSHASTPGTAT